MEITLNVEVRAAKGSKKELSTMRASSTIPAVVYGGESGPVNIALSEKDLMAARKKGGANAILHLKHAKGTETVVVKELQRHPVTDRPVHADFQRISLTKKIDAKVPLVLVGESIGVKIGGGMVNHELRELRIKALPTAIPQHIDVDISALELHQMLTVKDLKLADGIDVLEPADNVIVRIAVAKEIEVAAPVAAVPGAEGAAAAVEPESSNTKGKKDEDGKLVKETAPAAAPAVGAKKEPAKKEGK
jgi:large subunit ribosomal protein L25